MSLQSAIPPALHPLLARLVDERGYPLLQGEALEAFIADAGACVLFVTDDPVTQREVLDLAVILPELVPASARPLRAGLLPASAARDATARFGVRRTPALVYFRDGQYLGAIEGLRDWSDFVAEHRRVLDAEPQRAPSIGVRVVAANAPACH